MHYCNREHQKAHFPSHKAGCSGISKAQALVDEEEQELRNHPGDWMTPPHLFDNSVGRFWGIMATRDYMRARYALVEAKKKVKTRDSVQAQLEDIMDLLRLCRSDNLGLRQLAPALMLRLDKDQEAYDFIKWWATTGDSDDYDWGDMDLPFLDVKDADVFESAEPFSGRRINLSETVAVLLLKIKLLRDLTTLQNSFLLGVKVPREMLDRIQTHIPRSPIIAKNREIMERKSHRLIIEVLQDQVDELYWSVDRHNVHFWRAMLHPGRHLTARPDSFSVGTKQEMQLMLQYSYDAWVETPGAMDVIREKLAGDSDDGDVEDVITERFVGYSESGDEDWEDDLDGDIVHL
jgi:hypothetical protein